MGFPLWLEAMPVLADMLPTLLESFTSPRGLLRPSLRLRLTLPFSTAPTDTPMPVSMVDTAPMLPTPLPMDMLPMEPTLMPTARGLLMLSPRLMLRLTPLPTDMDTEPMEPILIPTTERGLLMLSLRLMPMPTTLVDTPMLVSMVDTEPMVPTLTPMDLDMDMASKMSSASV